MLCDLAAGANTISADLINIAIAQHALYVDLATYRLSEPWRTPVFRNRHLARAYQKGATQDEKIGAPSRDLTSSITLEGRELLERASDVDLATAVFRNRYIHPYHYRDDKQIQIARNRVAIPIRTKRRWQQCHREAEDRNGSGFLGLLPLYHTCGGFRQMITEGITLIHRVLETH